MVQDHPPEAEGIYPDVYNMKVKVDIKMRSEKDGNVYIAIQPANPLLYDPANVPQSLASYRKLKNLYNI